MSSDWPIVRQRALERLRRILKSAFRRCLIWTVSLLVAFYVPIHEIGPPFWTKDWTAKVTVAGRSSDVFLGVVAMVILSATDILDCVISRREKRLDVFSLGCSWILLAIYLVFILYGMPTYASSTARVTLPWTVIVGMLVICLLSELIIAVSSD